MKEGLGIRIEGLSKSFRHRPPTVENLNLEITPGSFVSILGPSGCGKSTLLRLIAGLESPTAGTVGLHPTQDNSIGFVFQEPNLLEWRNVYDNVHLPFELGPQFKNLPKKEREDRVQATLQKVHLAEVQNLFPHELSGGMKMRVSLARALVNNSRLLLMDEPFAALDEGTRFEMQNQLHQLWRNEGMTVIFVTHSLFEAAYLSERIVMLKGQGARIVLDEKTLLPAQRSEGLRTSVELNQLVERLSKRIRS